MVKLVAGEDPNWTAVAPVKSVPVRVTDVPPATGPLAGSIPVTTGRTDAARYVNWSAADIVLVPAGVVTVISTVPAEPAGETAVIWISESTVKLAAAEDPNRTAVAPVNSVPVRVTDVPPATGPLGGEIPLTAGGTGAATYVNWSAADVVLVPAGVVTVISTVPAEPAGETAVI